MSLAEETPYMERVTPRARRTLLEGLHINLAWLKYRVGVGEADEEDNKEEREGHLSLRMADEGALLWS